MVGLSVNYGHYHFIEGRILLYSTKNYSDVFYFPQFLSNFLSFLSTTLMFMREAEVV